jgi:5-carboxymethyl-2-hydroxymuconate isomerase
MPHITLEYSSNIKITKNFGEFFNEVHQLLVHYLHVDTLNCKSRVICHDKFYIADGNIKHAFAHLQIKVLDRHPMKGKQDMGNQSFKLLKEFFFGQVDGLCFQPSQ